MTPVFFYGLFMDDLLLQEKGLHPTRPILAKVKGWGLRIGARATLEASEREHVYGSIMALSNEDLDQLYGEESVADYIPQAMRAVDMQGSSTEVVAYVLPIALLSGSNSEYARSLASTARKMRLPTEYVSEIQKWI